MKDLREFLQSIEAEGELVRVRREVDPRFEASAILKKLDSVEGAAVIFEKVKGYRVPLLGNLCGKRKRLAKALKVNEREIIFKYMEALEKPEECKLVENGPVKEAVIRKDVDLLKLLPILTYHEKDAGPYITAGAVTYKDPESGVRGASIHRLQVKGKSRLGIFIATRPLFDYYSKAEASKKPFQVAIPIGLEPSTLLATCADVPVGFDKFKLVAPLRGGELELVRCETVDLEVPAHAEIAIEGEVQPSVYEDEGPFGEDTGYYLKGRTPVIKVNSVTHRSNPIYQAILPQSTETFNLIGIPLESAIYRAVKNVVPTVKGVYMFGFGHVAVSIRKMMEGDSKSALIATLANPIAKHAVVVDEDVDIFSLREIDWAIATRVQGDRNILVLRKMQGSKIDPSTEDGMVDKIGVDATKPLKAPPERFERTRIPGEEKVKLEEYL